MKLSLNCTAEFLFENKRKIEVLKNWKKKTNKQNKICSFLFSNNKKIIRSSSLNKGSSLQAQLPYYYYIFLGAIVKPVALSLNNGEGTEPFENGISLNSEWLSF